MINGFAFFVIKGIARKQFIKQINPSAEKSAEGFSIIIAKKYDFCYNNSKR